MVEYEESIKFRYEEKQYTFKTKRNPLNNNQMWWFEPLHDMYAGTVRDAKRIAKNIRKNAKIVGENNKKEIEENNEIELLWKREEQK